MKVVILSTATSYTGGAIITLLNVLPLLKKEGVDERSAAYIACGLSEESGEAVALTCTGATASRNYLSGLTEAYYRKLPILAITSTQHVGRIVNGTVVYRFIIRSFSRFCSRYLK